VGVHVDPKTVDVKAILKAARDRIKAEIKERVETERQERLSEKSIARAQKVSKSLAGFVREAWHILEPNMPYVHNWHIDAICEHLEAVTRGEITRLLINVPPGSMKSLLVSVF